MIIWEAGGFFFGFLARGRGGKGLKLRQGKNDVLRKGKEFVGWEMALAEWDFQ